MSTDRDKEGRPANRWPFDPMQPGDHEPAHLPDHLEKQPVAPPSPPAKEKNP
jgi:hypothetical protein